MNAKITILIENYSPVSLGLTGEHGLSMYIEYNNNKYLFDVGQSGNALYNAFKLNKRIDSINSIILSHGHYDHVGGLEEFLKYINRNINIYTPPKAFEKKYVINEHFGSKYIGFLQPKEYLETNLKAKFIDLKEYEEIAKGMHTFSHVPLTNDFEKSPDALKVKRDGKFVVDEFFDDLSLVLETDKGLVILLGCAHRGMVNICTEVKKKLNKNIFAVIGGTHIQRYDKKYLSFIKDYIKSENIQVFAPNHCTAREVISYFNIEMKEIFVNACCGSEICI